MRPSGSGGRMGCPPRPRRPKPSPLRAVPTTPGEDPVADDTDRAAASGEQMGDNVRQVLADRGLLQPGDVSVDWVILAHVNALGVDGVLRRRRVVLCMRDIDPTAAHSLIEMQTSRTEPRG